MKRTLLAIAITALALSGPAFAGKEGKGHGKKGHGGHDRVEHALRGHAPAVNGRHDNGLHLGHQKRAWARGERLPTGYLAPRYYVDDYRAYQLAPPPRGMVWVQPYEDTRRFYLVQAATGLIAQIFGR